MMAKIVKPVFGILLVLAGNIAWADCREWALEGDWTVFYHNNNFPTSVLAPDETIEIRFDWTQTEFSMDLSDPAWQAWGGKWEHECIGDQTILLGAIQRRGGEMTVLVEISRVVEAEKLMANASGEVKERQILIRFVDPFGSDHVHPEFAKLAEQGVLLSHGGTAHGSDD